MRVLVCGGRDFAENIKSIEAADQRSFVWNILRNFDLRLGPFDVVIHGDARGVDRCAGAWAESNHITVRKFPADWDRHGKSAGPIRNQQMLDEGKPDFVIAFPGGIGTSDMVARSKKIGVPVQEVRYVP